jgi:hypothetical protein
MNTKNKSVRNRIRKYHEDVARWDTPEHKAAHIKRNEERHIMNAGARVLTASAELVPSMQAPPRRTWRDAIKSFVKR